MNMTSGLIMPASHARHANALSETKSNTNNTNIAPEHVIGKGGTKTCMKASLQHLSKAASQGHVQWSASVCWQWRVKRATSINEGGTDFPTAL